MRKIIITIICILLTGCKLYDEYEIPKDVTIKVKNETIDVFKEVSIKKLLKIKNIELINPNKIINTKKIGKHEIIINYKYKRRKYKFNAKYNVVDKVKPIYLSVNTNRSTLIGENINLCENIVIADNYDKKPTCNIEGTFDINTEGNYNLKYVIEDKSGNKNEHDLVLSVLKEYPSTSNNSSNYEADKISFSDLVKNKEKNTELGIDVSAWQGNIDFEKVKKAGCKFVIIRMAYNYKGEFELDKYFKENLKKAKKAGLKVGIYVYTTAKTKKEVKKQVKFIVKNLKKEKLDLPIAYDFEDWSDFNEYNLSLYNLYELVKTFDEELRKNNYKTMLYSSKYYLEEVWLNKDKFDIWLAHYTDKTDYKGKYLLWQLGNTGQIDGIYGDVDIDIYYKKKSSK